MTIVLDVDPIAVWIFGWPVRWYGLILVVAAFAALAVARREARRRGIPDSMTSDGIVWVAIPALVGGRALYIVQNELPTLSADPLHAAMVWQGGLSFYGGLFAAIAGAFVFARRRGLAPLVVADVVAPGAALGQAIGHLGCLVSGDSYGLPATGPVALVYASPGVMAPLGVPLHPAQLYEALGLLVLFGLLVAIRGRVAHAAGTLAGTYLLGLAALRFGLFFLRDEPAVLLGLKTAQWLGLLVAGLGAALLIRAARGIQGDRQPTRGSIELDVRPTWRARTEPDLGTRGDIEVEPPVVGTTPM